MGTWTNPLVELQTWKVVLQYSKRALEHYFFLKEKESVRRFPGIPSPDYSKLLLRPFGLTTNN